MQSEPASILDYRTPGRVDGFFHLPLYVASLLTAVLVFPLVWMGGLVTSHSAGMSVPDWPNSYGYNMFALPFSMWIGDFAGGTFYEHTHRLLGTLVGLASFTATMLAWGPSSHLKWRRFWGTTSLVSAIGFVISLITSRWLRGSGKIEETTYQHLTHVFSLFAFIAIAALVLWRCRQRHPTRWLRWVVTALLGLIIIQGLMGGFRVTEISLLLAKTHGIFGQIVFALAGVVAVFTSRWWMTAQPTPNRNGTWLRRLTVAALCLILVQLTLGAFMRHDPRRNPTFGGGAGLAIPDWPLHYGKILPPTRAADLADANDIRVWKTQPPLPRTTLGAIWLHASHRIGAYLTTALLLALTFVAWKRHRDDGKLIWPSTALGVLVIAQVTLGVLTVLQRKPADIATLHQATGALLLVTASVLMVRLIKRYPANALAHHEKAATPQTTS